MEIKEFTTKILPIKDKLFRFSFRIVGNMQEAEDVVQEVFINLWNKRLDIHKLNNVDAFCMAMTKNLSLDKLRSKHKRVVPMPDNYDVPQVAANPLQQTEQKDMLNKVAAMINQLPENQKLVIQLRDVEGYTYNEISTLLKMSLDQVKVNLFRARKQIRTKLINTQSYGI